MSEIFLSLEDAARFENIKYKIMAQKINRDSSKFIIKKIKPENGGKDRVFVSLESLSDKARRAYAKSLQPDINKGAEKMEKNEIPWYVSVDINKYIEDNKEQYYKAIDLSRSIDEFLNYTGSNKTEYAAQVAEENGISQRSLYLQVEKYQEAQEWASQISSMDSMNHDYYRILALCRKPKAKGQFYSLDERIACLIENMLSDNRLAKNNITTAMIYDRIQTFSEENQIELPSLATVYRYVNMIRENNRGALYIAEKGTREYNRNMLLKGSRDTKTVKVMELVQGDGHTFDCFIKYTYPNGKVKAVKPKVLAWIDTRSRVIVGYAMCIEANAQVTKLSVLDVLYSYGTPEYMLIDNGKEYTAKELTGKNRKERFNIEVDEELLGFYKSVGIEGDVRRCTPYQPWKKGQIERGFRTVCNEFTKWFDSYVGTLTGSKTSGKIQKDIDKMLENGELLNLDEFNALWKEWIEKYHNKEHKGLKRMKEQYIKPIELFQNAERYMKAPPPKEYAVAQLMKSDDAYVYSTGIRKFGFEYRSVELGDYIGKHVDVKYDLNDVTILYVYNKSGELICEAPSWELLGMSPKVKYDAVADHMRLQNRQKGTDRDKLKKLQTPYEERETFKEIIEQHESHDGQVRGFTIANAKPKVKELENVTSLPVGKYEKKKDKDNVKSEYLQKLGEEAFKLMESM